MCVYLDGVLKLPSSIYCETLKTNCNTFNNHTWYLHLLVIIFFSLLKWTYTTTHWCYLYAADQWSVSLLIHTDMYYISYDFNLYMQTHDSSLPALWVYSDQCMLWAAAPVFSLFSRLIDRCLTPKNVSNWRCIVTTHFLLDPCSLLFTIVDILPRLLKYFFFFFLKQRHLTRRARCKEGLTPDLILSVHKDVWVLMGEPTVTAQLGWYIYTCLWFALCVTAGGATESSAEREEWPAVQDGGGPGGPQRADEETQGCCGSGLV